MESNNLQKERKSPIVQGEEELREKLLSFTKYISINHKRVPVSVSINFEDKFGGKGFAVIEVKDSKNALTSIVRAIESSAEDKLDSVLKQLRAFNDSNSVSDDNS